MSMFRRLSVLSLLVLCGLVAGLVLSGRMRSTDDTVALTVPTRETPAPAPPAAVQPALALPDLADVAERTVNAVANISAIQVVRTPASPFTSDPFFRYFFGDDPDMFSERRGQSAGSGVIVSADGYVLTNNHVVGENIRSIRDVTVILGDRRQRPARLVAVDPLTDLAVLKIDGRNLPTIAWGDSSKLRVAEWVLAIGNPYQLSQTVTLGIVSALGRSNITGGYEDFIQTDAAINPGNSGGALINARGELVGINTAIYSQTGGYQGIGFAVPSNLARRVMNDLLKYGEVKRGYIGGMQTVGITPELASELGTRSTRGALVWRMSRSSAAYDAGIRPGDVVETFNGQTVEDANHFLRLLADAPIGSTVTMGIRRDGQRFEVKVPVSKMPSRRAGV
jgi:Do/DeqQ family serine protease